MFLGTERHEKPLPTPTPRATLSEIRDGGRWTPILRREEIRRAGLCH
jgi:hypothetical protein